MMTRNEGLSYYVDVTVVEAAVFLRARQAAVFAAVQRLQRLRFLGNAERG